MLRVVFLLSGIQGCSTRCLKLGSDIEDDVTGCLPACGDLGVVRNTATGPSEMQRVV